MAGKPIAVSKFYSTKKPDIRFIIPSELNHLSEDSDCDSDDQVSSSRKKYDDIVIPETSSEEEEPGPKRTLPVFKKRKIISCEYVADRFAQHKNKKPPPSRKLKYPSPSPKKLEVSVSEEDDFTLKLQMSQEVENSLSSPCASPELSLLASPIHSDSDSSLRQRLYRVKSKGNAVVRNTSPDMFEECDEPLANSTPLTSVENVMHALQSRGIKYKTYNLFIFIKRYCKFLIISLILFLFSGIIKHPLGCENTLAPVHVRVQTVLDESSAGRFYAP